MPSRWTFTIPPIADLLTKYVADGKGWIDPFAGMSSPAELTNDIDPATAAVSHMDALQWLRQLLNESYRGALFDPPYSDEQCLRLYTPVQRGTAGRAEYWARCKQEIARVIQVGGYVVSCCWDSTGIGRERGFEIQEILLVCHGACHNDTIVTVERKVQGGLNMPSILENGNG